MSKSLVIAEKPSVASDIAKALGGFRKTKDFFESDRYIVSSAVGHLLELAVPRKEEVRKGKWTFDHLPMIPSKFALAPIKENSGRLKVLKNLLKRDDVIDVINACDAGREGELIFRNIVSHARCRKPIRRLWLQSMTPASIREGFASLRDGAELQPLADAAVCRSESDWLVGINGTRAMTAFNSRSGGFFKTTVGRVQTPTLTILVEREHEIRAFRPRTYWEVVATFRAEAGTYEGRWFDESFLKAERERDEELRPGRIWDEEQAREILESCRGGTGVATETSRKVRESAPRLFDLTTLQRTANSRFGFRAGQTLQLAQALYERHKLITYPRTDSCHLPEDYPDTVRQTLAAFASSSSFGPPARKILDNDWVVPDKRIFDNSKVSDHFAIIPTTQGRSPNLDPAEEKLLDLIVRRFLAVFHPPAEYRRTTRLTRVGSHPFRTEGRVLVHPGWREVYGRKTDDPDEMTPIATPEETVRTENAELAESRTRPRPRYNEATLLAAMEGAGKLVNDEDLREAIKDKGLGTPATRAAIIENLVRELYVIRDQKELVPTAKAFQLLTLLKGIRVEELCEPQLTGEWEQRLKQMEEGKLGRDEFMSGIRNMTASIVSKARAFDSDTVPGDYATLESPCPRCRKSGMRESYRNFGCDSCKLTIRKIIAGRLMEIEEIEELLREGKVGPLQGFRSKTGRPFEALLRLDDNCDAVFDFGEKEDPGEEEESVDFSGQEPLGPCPICRGKVYEGTGNYLCEKASGPEKSCDLTISKTILERDIPRAQVTRLLGEGRTELLDGFVSRRTGRSFEAFLVLDREKGGVGFEFPPRAAGRKKGFRRKTPAAREEPRIDFSGLESLGKCPICRGKVHETELGYLCERAQTQPRPCRFREGRIRLERTIEPEQMRKLLAGGRTDLIKGFVSRKSGRPFDAYLVINDKGRIGYEFPPREDSDGSVD